MSSSFLFREVRYRAETTGSNWLAELDIYLRFSQLRTPVLAVQNSDEFRVSLAERLAANSPSLPIEAVPDLIANALARRDLETAIRLLEGQRDRGFSTPTNSFSSSIFTVTIRASRRRKLLLTPKRPQSRKTDTLIGSGKNCRRNSDFALPAEKLMPCHSRRRSAWTHSGGNRGCNYWEMRLSWEWKHLATACVIIGILSGGSSSSANDSTGPGKDNESRVAKLAREYRELRVKRRQLPPGTRLKELDDSGGRLNTDSLSPGR